jgi:curved DNA-binding protein CbpA
MGSEIEGRMEPSGEEQKVELTEQEKGGLDSLHEIAEQEDYYTLLGVASQCDPSEARKSFYELSRIWHPDRFYRKKLGPYAEKLEFVFVSLTKAYHTITDEEARAEYDQKHRHLLDQGSLSPEFRAPVTPDTVPVVTDQSDGIHHEVGWGQGAHAGTSEGAAVPDMARRLTRRAPVPGVDKIRKQLTEQFARAKKYYEQGLHEAENGNFVKAASSMALAASFDPQNAQYAVLVKEYQVKSREQQAAAVLEQAEDAESMHELRRAALLYEKACSFNPSVGTCYFRLALIRAHEGGQAREVLRLLRQAAEKEPKNVKYKMSLARFFVLQGLLHQARREYSAVLNLDPSNAEAVAALKKIK